MLEMAGFANAEQKRKLSIITQSRYVYHDSLYAVDHYARIHGRSLGGEDGPPAVCCVHPARPIITP